LDKHTGARFYRDHDLDEILMVRFLDIRPINM